MCGVCGIINGSPEAVPLELIQTIARTMRHRGPDDEGYFTDGPVALGFQRLSIIDLAGGHQPFTSDDGALHLVFNGEIYNYKALRQALEATGRHRFHTQSDTEVLLHMVQEYGDDCVRHLRGMFAFAVWDARKKRLFMARDRVGKKPLYYAHGPGAFIFASEIGALLRHPSVSRQINYRAIDLFLTYQYIPSPSTIFRQIHKLPPAHSLTFESGELLVRRYWEPGFRPKTALSFQDASRAMMDKLRESTRLRLIADVPLGAFLSGGKDSSVIVGLMSELSRAPVKTFSLGFEDAVSSELGYARLVAERFHCDHHEFVVKPDAVELLPKLAVHFGEPFADPGAIPSYYISQLSRRHVTVALNGDGGDETMGGYPRYQAMKFSRFYLKLPAPARRALAALAGMLPDGPPPASKAWQIKRLLNLGTPDPRTAYSDSLSFIRETEKTPLYSDFLRQETAASFAPGYVNDVLASARSLSGIDPYLYTDLVTYIPECLMFKMDTASMAHGLEARSPFLDHEFIELTGSFPDTWKLRHWTERKYILNEAVRGWLPETIRTRGKQGFSLPIGEWLRGRLKDYVRGMILTDRMLKRNLFSKDGLTRLLDEHEAGRVDHTYTLWALLVLEHWFQACVDTPGP